MNNLVNDQKYCSNFHSKIRTKLHESGFSYIRTCMHTCDAHLIQDQFTWNELTLGSGVMYLR